MDLATLLGDIGKNWGYEVGNKVKTEIDKVIGVSNLDMAQLQSAITTIQGLLDADPSTPEFDTAQNIVAQLTDHLTRITALESSVVRLNAGKEIVGSVAYAVEQEKLRAVVAESALQTSLDNEAMARIEDVTDLQAQIDTLNGGSTQSIANIQAEIDAIEAGAGLNSDGTYTANTATNYIHEATSLKDADNKLDAKLKELEESQASIKRATSTQTAELQGAIDAEIARATSAEATAKSEAIAEAKAYTDTNFVSKTQLEVSATTLSAVFRQALDCAFNGATREDILNGTGICAGASGGSGDGAVI